MRSKRVFVKAYYIASCRVQNLHAGAFLGVPNMNAHEKCEWVKSKARTSGNLSAFKFLKVLSSKIDGISNIAYFKKIRIGMYVK